MASTHPASPAAVEKVSAPALEKISPPAVEKIPSGIAGFDQITGGGLPAGRSTLVCGGPGSGKTIFAVEFLVRGAELGDPGVFITFEESVNDLSRNVASLGFDLARLQRQKLLAVDYVHLDPAEIEEAGGYSLDGLFVRGDLAARTLSVPRTKLAKQASDHLPLVADLELLGLDAR